MKRSAGADRPALSADFRRALERGDDLVQTLTIAKYALALGDIERAVDALDTALARSREALTEMSELLGEQSMLAASLERSAPALTPAEPAEPEARVYLDINLTS